MWIVQETILAKKLYLLCGDACLEWTKWETFPDSLEEERMSEVNRWNLPGGYTGMFMREFWNQDDERIQRLFKFVSHGRKERETRHEPDFDTAWFSYDNRDCTVAQDRVYAMLNMVSSVRNSPPLEMLVDYTQHPLVLLRKILESFEHVNVAKFVQSYARHMNLDLDDIHALSRMSIALPVDITVELPECIPHHLVHLLVSNTSPIDESAEQVHRYAHLSDHLAECEDTVWRDKSESPLPDDDTGQLLYCPLYIPHVESPRPIFIVIRAPQKGQHSQVYASGYLASRVCGLHITDVEFMAKADSEALTLLSDSFRTFAQSCEIDELRDSRARLDSLRSVSFRATFSAVLALIKTVIAFVAAVQAAKKRQAAHWSRLEHDAAKWAHVQHQRST